MSLKICNPLNFKSPTATDVFYWNPNDPVQVYEGSQYILFLRQMLIMVHRCGASGSMRVCHAAGPGSIPGRDRFPGWGFFRGFSSPERQMSGNFRPPKVPEYHLTVIIIIPYSPCWDDWVCAWCVLSFMFVLSRRWPRHVLVWSTKYVCDP